MLGPFVKLRNIKEPSYICTSAYLLPHTVTVAENSYMELEGLLFYLRLLPESISASRCMNTLLDNIPSDRFLLFLHVSLVVIALHCFYSTPNETVGWRDWKQGYNESPLYK